MKILIITEDVGKSAPGIVFERLIRGLSYDNEVTLLVANYRPGTSLDNVSKVISSSKFQVHPRLYRVFISVFGFDPFDILWSLISLRKIKENTLVNFDLVFSFLSYSHYGGLFTGRILRRRHNIKLAVYSVDAIPPPAGWLKVDLFYKRLKGMIGKYLREADFFFSLNRQMLEYQLKTFTPKAELISGVIYTPGFNERKVYPLDWSGPNRFVYTGGIYGPRKPDYIIEGFRKFLIHYPDSRLQLVGTQINDTLLPYKNHEKVEFLPFTNNLEQYYAEATALIDIDADLENDVFLSSKMPNYLMVNRIVISETGQNSPSRHLFTEIKSIFQCDHDSDQLCRAMIKAVEMRDSISFDDRDNVIALFNIDSIMVELKKTLLLNN